MGDLCELVTEMQVFSFGVSAVQGCCFEGNALSGVFSFEARREVERELTGEDKEPWEIVYFKLYKSQIPVIDRALETAALMLGSDRSRSYCLEMICADFLAGANLDNGDPETLLFSMTRFFRFLPEKQKQAFLEHITEKAS